MKEDVKKIDDLKPMIDAIIEDAKKNNRIYPHTKAFEDYPVSEEDHKGNIEYFLK